MSAAVTLFRALLIASVATGVVGGFIDRIFPSLVPESVVKAFEALPAPPMPALVLVMALFLITFGGMITAIIGLYFFQPWSRKLAVLMTLLGLLFYPLLGAYTMSGWAAFFTEISTTLWGAVLAMSFVSSLNVRFETDPTR